MEQLKAFNITDILPSLNPDQVLILPGVLNYVLLLHDKQGNLYVQRTARKDRTAVFESINREYQATGFFDRGGSYTMRSFSEQAEFMKQCRNLDLCVAEPIYSDEETMYLPFIEGDPYHLYLATKPQQLAETVRAYLRSITDAHSLRIVYGDRWGSNTIIDRQRNLWHIDFDINLQGLPAQEFEIAQALYFSIYFASDRETATRECIEFIHDPSFARYHLGSVLAFLQGHTAYFQDGEYGDIQAEIIQMAA